MQKNKLAFIGGSGIYNLDIFEKIIEHDIVSVFGKPSSKIIEGKINNNSIFFLSRHGIDHRISPSEIMTLVSDSNCRISILPYFDIN